MNDVKNGFLTSEFWLTLAVQAIALAVLIGAIPSKDAPQLTDALTNAVKAAFALFGSAWSVVHYIQGRSRVKQAAVAPALPK